jgi:TonB family protein
LQPGGIKALGEYTADQLSDALAQRVGPTDVIDRKRLYSYLQASGASPLDLADPEAAAWIASQIGASAIVFGRLTLLESKLRLSSDLIRVEDAKRLGSSKIDFLLTDQLKQLLSKPFFWPASADVVMACAPGANADFFKAAGLTMPTCIHCPNPDYNDAARKARFQGNLKFDVVVDELGRAKRITAIKADKNGLTARAIDAIRGWKFKPAMRDGKPVTVCVCIEVVFRLF